MKTICDRCNKYEIHPSGVTETCHAYIEEQTKSRRHITKDYIELRMTGEKNNCKQFKKL